MTWYLPIVRISRDVRRADGLTLACQAFRGELMEIPIPEGWLYDLASILASNAERYCAVVEIDAGETRMVGFRAREDCPTVEAQVAESLRVSEEALRTSAPAQPGPGYRLLSEHADAG